MGDSENKEQLNVSGEISVSKPMIMRQTTGAFDNPNSNAGDGGEQLLDDILLDPGPVGAPLLRRQLSGLQDQCIDIETEMTQIADLQSSEAQPRKQLNVLMIGTGEYTTGYGGSSSKSDKSAGVVALTLFDLRRRGLVNRLGLCGVNGTKFPAIRQHLKTCIAEAYTNLRGEVIGPDESVLLDTFPEDTVVDAEAYREALLFYQPGDVAIIFTPDNTHFDIASACIEHGLHVLVTKPVVKTLDHHRRLAERAKAKNVLVGVEVHKRLDPIYVDARDRIQRNLGHFSYIYSYMSQPKYQLNTFKAWAGRDSDISYYLNSHHIDFHEWCTGESGRPLSVTAIASTGVAPGLVDHKTCEDTITLTVQWELFPKDDCVSGSGAVLGTAVYTSSWIAPASDVHSQQRFFYMGHKGEISVDQAHRGYTSAVDKGGEGLKSVNPLFMKYTPGKGQSFVGQQGYGYRSFEAFIMAATRIAAGEASPADYDESSSRPCEESIASIHDTYRTTAILEAGRMSLDTQCTVEIQYESGDPKSVVPTGLRVRPIPQVSINLNKV